MAHFHTDYQAVSEFVEATKSKQPENDPAITADIPGADSATSMTSEQFKALMISTIRDMLPETFLVDDVVGFWKGLGQDDINPKDEARYLRQRRQRYAWVEGLRNDPGCARVVEREDKLLAEMDRRLADKLPSSSTTEPKGS